LRLARVELVQAVEVQEQRDAGDGRVGRGPGVGPTALWVFVGFKSLLGIMFCMN